MRTTEQFIREGTVKTAALLAYYLAVSLASAGTVEAVYNSATDVPITTSSYSASGNTIHFTLNFAPDPVLELMVVKVVGPSVIQGNFDNLTNGQPVTLSYGGTNYSFVANYYGGSGNDLVLVWASSRAYGWGMNDRGQLGDNTTNNRSLAAPVTDTGVLAGKTVVAVTAGAGHSLALCSDGLFPAILFSYSA